MKIVKWKEKSRMPDIIVGMIGLIFSSIIVALCFFEDSGVALLTLIFTTTAIYGARIVINNKGSGREVYYVKKVKRRNKG